MATSDFLPLAVGVGANVETQAAYAAETALLDNGFQAGVAPSAKFNKALRQSTIMAAVLAKWIADKSGANSVDDGTTATLISNLTAAVSSLASVVDASTTVKGKVQLATAAEAQDLADALKAITPSTLAGAFGGANKSHAASGYQKLPGGLIIQWGQSASISSDATVAITFPIAFPSACFVANATSVNSDDSTTKDCVPQIKSVSTTQVVIRGNNVSSGTTAAPAFWIAIGN